MGQAARGQLATAPEQRGEEVELRAAHPGAGERSVGGLLQQGGAPVEPADDGDRIGDVHW